MLEEIALRNFKLFDEVGVDIKLGGITVLIGPNGTGKSSVLQALGLLKQSRQQDHFRFDGPQIWLGSFRDIVHHQQTNRRVSINLSASYNDFNPPGVMTPPIPRSGVFTYHTEFADRVGLTLNEGSIGGSADRLRASWSPAVSWTEPEQVTFDDGMTTVKPGASNTITNPLNVVSAVSSASGERLNEVARSLRDLFLTLFTLTGQVYLVPAIRGFGQSTYEILPEISSTDLVEAGGPNEQACLVANLIASEPQLADTVSARLRDVLPGEEFRLRTRLVPGGRIAVEVAASGESFHVSNAAFGLNQLVPLLMALGLVPDGAIVGIEEPEIHLHPRAQAALARVFVDATNRDHRQLILTTHSEHILMGLLSAVAHRKLKPAELSVYEFRREGGTSRAERLEVNEYGQVQGGLSGFLEVDLDEIDDLLSTRFPSPVR